ncbi:MAG TPA: hypothetical protein VF753_06100 [Terriglobales bacterium]
MPVIVVGGNARNVGKTSVVAGLIGALREYSWTAIKITPHRHESADPVGKWNVVKETDPIGGSDTSRFLAAGAERAYLVVAEPDQMDEAMAAIRKVLADSKYAIVESNSIMRFLQPDLYLPVIDPTVEDFKASAKRFFDRADAVIMHRMSRSLDTEQTIEMPAAFADRPIFLIEPPRYVTPEIVAFVRKALSRRGVVSA